jgi:CDP-diacylglycerol--serine O-phosphatidyltransferase
LDGRIARLTKTESAFGLQLDSLADVINCGVAPAFLLYYWTLHSALKGPFDPYLLLAFFYVACAAGRLARFNVDAEKAHPPENRNQEDDPTALEEERAPRKPAGFSGIPSPVAAMLLCTAVMAHKEIGLSFIKRAEVMGPYVLGVSLLMISTIPFRSFHEFRSRFAQYLFFGSILLGFVVLAAGGPGGVILWCLLLFYVFGGLLKKGISMCKREG